jgi:mannose-6-phosphate isomerase-like protein (cupin superfamily)
MRLPNGPANPERRFQGQKFVHHKAERAIWKPFRLTGFQSRDTTIAQNTQNVAGVHVVRPAEGEPIWSRHDADILFTFVMEGRMVLEDEDEKSHTLEAGDAFVIPPGMRVRYREPTADLELLEVSLPGVFETTVG